MPTPTSCPMPAKSGVQKILMNDFANEHVTDTFFFTYCYIKSKDGHLKVLATEWDIGFSF